MIKSKRKFVPKFLQDGGEMGRIISDVDWSSHPLGEPVNWPVSLKVTISNILKTAFPKFVWWGSDLICFYNDAYRPSLGKDGKHPFILGEKAEVAWPEIWDTIKPLIDQVLKTGKPIWSENQLIPIYRNGRMENVYWTFSYSALLGDDENISGILVTCAETTEAVLNLKRLEESRRQLNFTIDAAELGTWDYNPQTKKLSGNARFRKWFGFDPNEEISLPKAILSIPSKDRAQVRKAIKEALEGKNDGKYDITCPIEHRKTDEYKIVRALGRAIFNDDGQAHRFNGTLQDVTEQAKHNEELRIANTKIRKEEQRFRNIVHDAPVGIAIFVGEDLIVEMANLSLLKIVDITSAKLVGKKLFEAIPEIKEVVGYLFNKIHRTNEAVKGTEFKIPIKRKGHIQEAYFDFVLHPIRIEKGNVLEIMLVGNEVTDYVIARNTLAENESQFRNLVLQSPVAKAIFKGKDLRIEMANYQMLDHFWGRTWDEVNGKDLIEVFPELKGQHYIRELKRVIRTGKAIRNQNSKNVIFKGGEKFEFYVDYVYLPLREVDGSVYGVMITVTDVTNQFLAKEKLINFSEELKILVEERTELLEKANIDLELYIQKLEKANAELESFAYVSSHDLQEPLRKIQMYISRFEDQESGALSNTGQKYFQKIEESASRMRVLIDDLLAFSRTEEDRSKLEATELNHIVGEVLENLSSQIERTGAKITTTDLPKVRAIPFQMRQVFNNLISNALKFSVDKETPCIEITTTNVKGKSMEKLGLNSTIDYHKISVKDYGIGFASGMEHKIFEVFQRLHGKQEFEGTGIGLAIVKKIMHNHGGAVTAASKENKGATFSIYLPHSGTSWY